MTKTDLAGKTCIVTGGGRGLGRNKGVGRQLWEKVSDVLNVSDVFGRLRMFSDVFEHF